ncbi:unnamed protein product [Cuscuta europaea]|uniref:Uncharacterized protein n=1 Tax=Cuscuta europaea TaxID=41803 RepID=A0A9P0ZAQ1_CUSEU|nr:unnamed protein product [Cuscuta europaea]
MPYSPRESSPTGQAEIITVTNDGLFEVEKFQFFGEEGFDSIKLESKLFKFGIKNEEITVFEIKISQLHKISFNLELAPQIILYIYQLTTEDFFCRQLRRFGPISVSSNFNKAGGFITMAKDNGYFIAIPVGPQNSGLLDFLAIFSNFVGISNLELEEPMHRSQETSLITEEPTSISKLIFYFQIQGAYLEKHWSPPPEKQNRLIQAFSDASDCFYH